MAISFNQPGRVGAFVHLHHVNGPGGKRRKLPVCMTVGGLEITGRPDYLDNPGDLQG